MFIFLSELAIMAGQPVPIPTSAGKILSIADLERAASDKLQVSARGINLL